MYRAIQANDSDQVDALLASGFNIEDSISAGYTPLQMAVQVGPTEIAEPLFDRRANVNLKNSYNSSASSAAAFDA